MNTILLKIEHALKGELPGSKAHKQFSPPGRIKSLCSFDKDSALLSSVLLLLFPMNGEICIAFIKRPQTLRNHAGQVSFPGGKFEETDSDLYETAIRETYEEVGVDPNRINYLGKLSEIYVPVSGFCIHPFVAYTTSTPAFEISHDEVDRLIIIPLKEFYNPETLIEVEKDTYAGSIQVPGFSVKGEFIWGATAMILTELLNVIDEDWLNRRMSMPDQTQICADKSDNAVS